MEQWASANGVWSQSEFYLQVKQKRKHRSYGSRRWLTRGELLQKYGDSAVVDAIIAAKMADPEASKSQVRCHPDLHGQDTEASLLSV